MINRLCIDLKETFAHVCFWDGMDVFFARVWVSFPSLVDFIAHYMFDTYLGSSFPNSGFISKFLYKFHFRVDGLCHCFRGF